MKIRSRMFSFLVGKSTCCSRPSQVQESLVNPLWFWCPHCQWFPVYVWNIKVSSDDKHIVLGFGTETKHFCLDQVRIGLADTWGWSIKSCQRQCLPLSGSLIEPLISSMLFDWTSPSNRSCLLVVYQNSPVTGGRHCGLYGGRQNPCSWE